MDNVSLEKLVIEHERILNNGLCKAVQDLTAAVKQLIQDRDKDREKQIAFLQSQAEKARLERYKAWLMFLAGTASASAGAILMYFLGG